MLTGKGFENTFRYMQLFWRGTATTVALSVLTVLFGFILALFLAGLRLSKNRPLKWLATGYVELFRATPMVVQVFFIYYVVFAGLKVAPNYKLFGFIAFDRFFPAVVALALNSGAYLSEIIRSGIQSIDKGQTEAARSMGLSSWQTMQYVILPQAIKNILPAIANEFVTIIKESAICYTIGVQDIMSAVNSVKGATFRIGEPLVIATALYFCLTYPTSKVIAYFERKMSHDDQQSKK